MTLDNILVLSFWILIKEVLILLFMDSFKNKCFPFYSKNNFSSPSYKYTGNPKEKDNLIYLSFKIKDIMIKGGDKAAFNRQYNNELP